MLVMEEAGEVQDTPKTDHDCSEKDGTSPKERIASSDIAEDLSNNCQRNGVDNAKTIDDTKTNDSNKSETKENSKTDDNLEEKDNTKMKKEDFPKKETRNSVKERNEAAINRTNVKLEKDVVIENANKLVNKECDSKNVVEVTGSESGKRSIEESNGPPLKKSKIESLNDLREDIVSEFVESASSTLDDIQQQETKLVADIEYLDETARAKEREWNDIIRLKKFKEEILLRLQRKRQVILISSDSNSDNVDWELALDMHIKSLNNDNGSNQSGASVQSLNLAAINLSNSSVSVLPVSSSNSSLPKRNAKSIDSKLRNVKKAYLPNERSLLAATLNRQRSILPKPSYNLPSNSYDYNSTSKTGPKGQPMMDVNLIVEKFRQNHPEEVPRRGRRVKSVIKNETDIVSSSSRQSVLSSLQGAPSRVDLNSELGMMLTTGSDMRNRSSNSSNDSTQNHSNSETASAPSSSGGNVSFKDVLVQFARLSQAERRDVLSSSQPSTTTGNNFVLQRGNTTIAIKPPPPPYPEVTLHPVLGSGGTVVSSSQSSTSNSLLHGILTKNQQPSPESKPFTALSPTLARLLTGSASQPSDVSDISDLLNNPQNQAKVPSPRRQTQSLSPPRSSQSLIRVPRASAQVITSSVHSSQFQPPAGVVNLDDMETEDSADRLVIDESHEASESQQNKGITEDAAEAASDSAGSSGQVPPCQGCKENPAQFVCAGCTSQWYCSRECQVSDWDDHSEMCSG